MDEAIPETVRSAVVRVCRDAFHWRGDVRSLFLAAGVPAAMYDRYDQPELSKAKIARAVLSELQALGVNGQRIQRKLVEELCRMDRPHPDAPDQALGRAALADLKREAASAAVLVDPERAAAAQRRARAAQQRRAVQQRQQQLGDLCSRFFDLVREQPRSRVELQRRGYALEALVADLFEAYDLQYRRPYRIEHEQVDGRLDGGQSARSFLHTSGVDTGRGAFTTWRAQKLGPLADHAAWLVHQHWVTIGQPNRAELVGRYAWAAGGRDPRLVAAHARRVAASGSVERFTLARDICDEAALDRRGSTHDGWAELREVRNRIAGQLARRQLRPSGKVDHNGNPIPVRRHHPARPERTRPGRFTLDR